MSDEPTIGDLIAKHNDIKAYIEAEQEEQKEKLKPYNEALFAIKTAIGVKLQEQKLQNFKTDDGTAYLKHDLGVKVDNAADFLNFVRLREAWDLVDVRALPTKIVETAEEKTGGQAGPRETFAEQVARLTPALPKGITLNPSITCLIRR